MSSNLAGGRITVLPPANVVTASVYNVGPGPSTVYTVTTGRTFYCTQITFFGANTITSYTLKKDSTTIMQVLTFETEPKNVTFVGSADAPLFSASSGQAITTTAGASNDQKIVMTGFEI